MKLAALLIVAVAIVLLMVTDWWFDDPELHDQYDHFDILRDWMDDE